MISGSYLCVRAAKMTLALQQQDWVHDGLSIELPRQMREAYRRLRCLPFGGSGEMVRRISEHDACVLHVHNEPNWPAIAAKRASMGRPVILDVHDITSANPGRAQDRLERQAYEEADAFVFVSEEQRSFASSCGLPIEGKPYAVLPNYASSSLFIEGTPLPPLGGVVYEGGAVRRGDPWTGRDYSTVADALGGGLHMFVGQDAVPDYGLVHPREDSYRVLIHRLAQFDWGLVGTANPDPGWSHAVPNKVFDYMSAGIPFIALNVPMIRPLCGLGMGVYCESVDGVREAATLDPEPYRRQVLTCRANYTMESAIAPVVRLYGELLEA